MESTKERIIVAGSRTYNNYDFVRSELEEYIGTRTNIVIVSGGANGVDKLGEIYAKEKDFECLRFPANWDKYGKSAGYRRNVEMSKNADTLFAFWNGESKGTRHMIDIAKKKGLRLIVVRIDV